MSETRTYRRVNMTQLLHLWEFLNTHREIALGYNKSIQARQQSKQMWERAANILNSAGDGAMKSASEWSKYWVDMKARLKKKNRIINDSRRRTGGGPGTHLELSEIDRKFLSILGEDLGSGLPGVRVEPPDRLVLEGSAGDNIASPSNMDTSQSTAAEEPIFLEVLSSEEYQQSQPCEIMPSQHSAQSPVPANPQPSSSRQSTTGQSPRRRLILPAEAEPSPPLSRQSTAEQGPTRRRRRRRQQLSAADARLRLVTCTERRTQAELANSRSIERGVQLLGEIVSILRNIYGTDSNANARGAQRDPA